jgi:hypothetical protein
VRLVQVSRDIERCCHQAWQQRDQEARDPFDDQPGLAGELFMKGAFDTLDCATHPPLKVRKILARCQGGNNCFDACDACLHEANLNGRHAVEAIRSGRKNC